MKNEIKERPGFMIYHGDLNAISHLDSKTFKSVMMALGRLSAFGEEPEGLDGMAGCVYEIMRDKIIRDHERYTQRIEAGRTGGLRSAQKRRDRENQPEADGSEVQAESGEGEAKPSEVQAKPSEAQAKDRQESSEFKRNQPTVTVTPTVTPTATVTPTVTPTVTVTPAATAASTSSSTVTPPGTGGMPEIIISAAKEEEFPPTREMIISYAREKGIEVDADDFLARCREADWKDGKGEPVRNWRMWLKGYLIRRETEKARTRCGPDPRIYALEQLKRKYMAEEAAARE